MRAERDGGCATKLVNKPRTVERYAMLGKDGTIGTQLTKQPGAYNPEFAWVRLIYTDGILTGVNVSAPNQEPHNV